MENKNYVIFAVLILLLILPLVSAQLYFKQSTDFDLKRPCFKDGAYCSGLATCLITITDPDGNLVIDNQQMTNQISYHNISILGNYTSKLGEYPCVMTCTDVNVSGSDTFFFTITGNGKEPPSGIVIVLFTILFLVIIAFMLFFLLYSVGHIFNLDFDIIDLAYNWGAYFALLALFLLEGYYLGNPDIHSWMLWLIYVGGVTNFFIPLIALFLSVFIAPLIKRRKSPNGL